MGVQRALRRPGRPRRVDENRRIFGRRRDRFERVGHTRDRVRVLDHPVGIGAVDRDHACERGQALGDGQHAVEALGVRDDDLRAGVAQPVLEGLGAESVESGSATAPSLYAAR